MKNIKKYRGVLTKFNDTLFIEKYYEDYLDAIEFSKGTDFESCPLEQIIYNWINDIKDIPKTNCGKPREFVSISKGYNMFCKKHCDCMRQYNKEKREATCMKKYGVTNAAKTDSVKNKMKQTNMKKYGVEYCLSAEQIREKIKKTNLNVYGVEVPSKSEEIKKKIKKTNLERYGVEVPSKSEVIQEKMKRTNLERYGVENVFQHGKIRDKFMNENYKKYGNPYHINIEKTRQTNLKKYGVEWCCMRKDARNYSSDSKPNLSFATNLEKNNIVYEREFNILKYSYDFKVCDTLIEINPTITHNSYMNIFNRQPLDKNYHSDKSNVAKENGYKCIHIWEWDNIDKIINILKPKETLYARNLTLKEVSEKECNEFLNLYHLQNTCRGQTIRYGLYKDDMLVMLMTFGKPRYNKNYEYELLRLCSHKDYKIVGGAEKIFKYILNIFNIKTIISYCDISKFSGDIYFKLGFKIKNVSDPGKHWYNIKTGQHITDNLLRQRGFDQLFGTHYGKGTSNDELMLEHGFLPVYDCGQMTFIFTSLSKE